MAKKGTRNSVKKQAKEHGIFYEHKSISYSSHNCYLLVSPRQAKDSREDNYFLSTGFCGGIVKRIDNAFRVMFSKPNILRRHKDWVMKLEA